MRVLVTGATGFLGSRVALGLLDRGDSVSFLTRSRPKGHFLEARGARGVEGDIRDPAALLRAADGCEAVVHCAGIPRPASLRAFRGVHVEGTRRILEAARARGARRLVNVASQAVVFRGDDILGGDESMAYPRRFIDPYSATKAEAEELALRSNGEGGLEVTSVRPALVWGRGDTTVLPILVRLALGRLGIPRSGSGDNIEATTHIRNAVAGILRALDGPRAPGRAYFIVDGFQVGWREFISLEVEAAGVEPRFFRIPRRAAAPFAWAIDRAAGLLGLPVPLAYFGLRMSLTSRTYSIARAREEIGYSPEIGLEEGLADLREWVLELGGPAALVGSARPAPIPS